jgi:hypothetical protein
VVAGCLFSFLASWLTLGWWLEWVSMGHVGYSGQKWLIQGQNFWCGTVLGANSVSVNLAPNFWFGLICGLRVWQFGAKILFFDFISW